MGCVQTPLINDFYPDFFSNLRRKMGEIESSSPPFPLVVSFPPPPPLRPRLLGRRWRERERERDHYINCEISPPFFCPLLFCVSDSKLKSVLALLSAAGNISVSLYINPPAAPYLFFLPKRCHPQPPISPLCNCIPPKLLCWLTYLITANFPPLSLLSLFRLGVSKNLIDRGCWNR